MRPYVVDEVQSADYDAETAEPEELTDARSSAETADILTELMVSTVDDGTASPAAIPGRRRRRQDRHRPARRGRARRRTRWFVSFAPAEDAEVAVAVMIEEAPGREIAGGALGGPIAKAVMEAVLG